MSALGKEPLGGVSRLWFAWVCFFKVLLDGQFARRCFDAQAEPVDVEPVEKPAPLPAPEPEKAKKPEKPTPAATPASAEPDRGALQSARNEGALMLLALLQTEGRLVDFLKQDIAGFDDADIGTAARVIHEGCNRALKSRVAIEPVRTEAEGSALTLEGYDAHEVKVIGNVSSSKTAVKGTLRHRGWRATEAKLPEPAKGHVAQVICPAEVEV
ncbi:MAG: DUF2760 domain-containing protein [Polyangiaceae bacterium]